MSTDDENLFRMLASTNFADDVCCFDRTICERILHVDIHARSDTAFDQAFQLALVLVGHRNDGNCKIGVKTENPRVRQIHAGGTRSALPTNYGDNTCTRERLKKISKVRED